MSRVPIAERLKRSITAKAKDVEVCEVRIGLIYTAVRLEDGRAGIALTLQAPEAAGCPPCFENERPLAGRKAVELLDKLGSPHPAEAAVALACTNAIANVDRANYLDGHVLEHLELDSSIDLAMIGDFRPVADALAGKVRSLSIFELVDEADERVLPIKEANDRLPTCQVVLVTGTTLVNGTLDALFEPLSHCQRVVLLGASTPIEPEAFAETPLTHLAGVVVQNADEVLHCVSEAGGMRELKPHIRKVVLPLC